jgi:plasmid maintenance system killer protein
MYRAEFAAEFLADKRRYAGIAKLIQGEVDRVLADPYNSELLTKKRSDLRGHRSVRVTRNFRIVFIVCEECIQRDFRGKGYPDCAPDCSKILPTHDIVFVAVGPHERVYDE